MLYANRYRPLQKLSNGAFNCRERLLHSRLPPPLVFLKFTSSRPVFLKFQASLIFFHLGKKCSTSVSPYPWIPWAGSAILGAVLSLPVWKWPGTSNLPGDAIGHRHYITDCGNHIETNALSDIWNIFQVKTFFYMYSRIDSVGSFLFVERSSRHQETHAKKHQI